MNKLVYLLLTAAMLSAPCAYAQQVFCKVEGQRQGIIKGDTTIKGREDTLTILSIASGVQIPFNPATGQNTGKRQHQPLTIVKNLDKASPRLFLAAVTNESLKQVDCLFYPTTGTQQAFFRIQLLNAFIVETDISGNTVDNNGVHETVRIAFEKIILEDIAAGISAEDDVSSVGQ